METVQEQMEREIAEGTFVPKGRVFDLVHEYFPNGWPDLFAEKEEN